MKTSEKLSLNDFECIADIPMTGNLVVDVGIIIEEFRSALRSACRRYTNEIGQDLEAIALENKRHRREDMMRLQEKVDMAEMEKSRLILENEKLKERLRVALEPKKEKITSLIADKQQGGQ